ncbi:hypothetical protein ACFL35_07780, partial [Candidatus Riflebacteria bacterium]
DSMDIARAFSGKLQLIDGGFYHNNPMKAAVDLGATHIIVIRSSPPFEYQEIEETSLKNLKGIIHLLLNRAESEDYQAALLIPTYLITPRAEDTHKHLTVFDFDGRFDSKGFWPIRKPSVSLTDYIRYGEDVAYDEKSGFIEMSKGLLVLPEIDD